MGEVYRARDDRLGRTVTIKVLPEAVADVGGEPKAVPGLSGGETVVDGDANADVAYVAGALKPDATRVVDKLDLRTGRRQPFLTVAPSDPGGLAFVGAPIFSPDGEWYVFPQAHAQSTLYLATGLK